jgi:hypothetical protein
MVERFLFQEKVFQAKLRCLLEPTDFLIKKLTRECLAQSGAQTPQQVFSCLKDWHKPFWQQVPEALVVLMEWAHKAAFVCNPQQPQAFFVEDLKVKIWHNYIQRLSLDSWLLLGKDQKSRGNEVLEIFMRVISDTLYSQFPLVMSLPPLERPSLERLSLERNTLERPSLETLERDRLEPARLNQVTPSTYTTVPPQRSQYRTLYENYNSNSNTNPHPTDTTPSSFGHYSRRQLDPIAEDPEVALLKNSKSLYLPRADARGLPVKLSRHQEKEKEKDSDASPVSNKSRSRKKMTRAKRDKYSLDSDSSSDDNDHRHSDEED